MVIQYNLKTNRFAVLPFSFQSAQRLPCVALFFYLGKFLNPTSKTRCGATCRNSEARIGEKQKSSAKYSFTKNPESSIIGAERLNESRWNMNRKQSERIICAAICQSNGLKAKDIARQLNLERSTVNRVLYASPLLKDLCYQDDSYRWHGIIRQSVPHDGLYEFSGYYAKVSVFLSLTEDE